MTSEQRSTALTIIGVGFAMLVGVAMGYAWGGQDAEMSHGRSAPRSECATAIAVAVAAEYDACNAKLAAAKDGADYACMAKLDPSGCVPELHDLMAGTYHRTPPGSTDCSRTADGGVWSW